MLLAFSFMDFRFHDSWMLSLFHLVNMLRVYNAASIVITRWHQHHNFGLTDWASLVSLILTSLFFSLFVFLLSLSLPYMTSLHTFRHFFFTVMLFVYGRILSQRLVNTVTMDKFLYKLVGRLIKYHMVTCYFLYIAGWYISWYCIFLLLLFLYASVG